MTVKEKKFNPLKEELFFLEYDLDEMYDLWHHEVDGPKYQRLEAYIWQMLAEDVPAFLKILDNSWRKRVTDPVFALRLARYYLHPVRRLVCHLASEIQHQHEPDRDLVEVRFEKVLDRSYITIDKNGFKDDVTNWTERKVNVILNDVIVLENYKGNCLYLLPTGSLYGVEQEALYDDHYNALKMLCERFEEGIVRLSD